MLASVFQRLRDVWGGLNTIVKVGGTLTALIGIVATLIQTWGSIQGYFGESAALRDQIAIADRRLAEKDYAAAWAENAKALQLGAKNAAALEQQTRIAMRWLENARLSSLPGARGFTDIARPLEDALIERSPKLSGVEKAEVEAHIGWARFLRSRDSNAPIDVDGPLDTALRLDPGNATAHAIKGFWRIWQAKSPAAARPHFDAALAAKQESPFADGLIIAAWMNFWSSGEPFAFGAVDYANRLRKLGRLKDGEPSIARLHGIYVDGLRDPAYLARLDRVIPPADHAELLALLDKERLSNNERLATAALRAHYLAQAGAAAEARRLYEKVVAETPQLVDQKASDFAKAGLAKLAH